MAEEKIQKQHEVPTGGEVHAEEGSLPPRGTGRRTGTAKKPTGPDDRLTEEERKKRHKKEVG